MRVLILSFLFKIGFVCIIGSSAQAFILDVNTTIFQDSQTTATDAKSSRSMYNIAAYGDLSRAGGAGFHLGWSVFSVAQKTELGATTSEELKSLDMGPALRWSIDRNRIYSLTVVYGVTAKGSYSSGSATSQDIRGTQLFAKIAVEPPLNDNWHAGFAINYYSTSYNLAVSNSTETTISYKNNWIFPTISISYHY